jgi:hypothetical protein
MHSKKLFLSSAVLFVSVTLLFAGSVGASSEMWSQTYGGPKSETATSLVEASDGGFVLSGGSLLVKTDANGVMEWNQTYPVPTGSLIETADGGYGIAGGGSLAKLDLYGNLEWDQTYSGGSANSLIETSDGGYALAGTSDSLDSNGTTDFWLVKTDSNGVMEWNQTYGGAEVERAYSLVETSDEGFALAGERIVSLGDGYRAWRFWLVRTDEDGNMLWNQTYGIANDGARSLVRTSDGGYALAGFTYIWDPANLGVGNYDFWLVKTDSNGVMEWNQTYARTDVDKAYSLIETSDGGYALAGESYSAVTVDEEIEHDCWLVKTDRDGNVEWNQTYGEPNEEAAYALIETSDGGYALAGSTQSYGAGNTDFLLIKTDEYGIPEFPSWVILPLLVAATLAAVLYTKRLRKSSHS